MCHLHPRSIRALDGSELCCCYFLNELYELSSPDHGIDAFFPFFSHDCFCTVLVLSFVSYTSNICTSIERSLGMMDYTHK